MDAELAGGGNEKEVDANGEEVKEEEDVAIDNVNDAEDGIECQCCFADYPFVRIPMLNLLIRYSNLFPSLRWFSAPKLTSSVQPVSQHTHPLNSALITHL